MALRPTWKLGLVCAGLAVAACTSTDGSPARSETTTVSSSPSTTASIGSPRSTSIDVTTTSRPADDSTSPPTSTSTIPTYEVFDLEDVSFGNTVRYVAHVSVEGTPGIDHLVELAVLIEKTVRAEHPYQALSVGFYDYPEYLGFGFVMGRVEFAPFGDWGRASEVELGEYSSIEAKSFLRDKDWSHQPSQAEVTVWRRWEEVINQLDPDLTRDDVVALEAEAYQVVANEFSLSVAEVEEAVQRAAFWPFS